MIKRHKSLYQTAIMSALLSLAGCYTPVEDLKPTSFDQKDLDNKSEGRVVTILSIMPSRATVLNTNNEVARNITEEIGGALGATVGIFGFGDSAVDAGASFGTLAAGAIAPPQFHPLSLILIFQDPNDPEIQETVEIAKVCEFKTGTAYAVEVNGETKIQPNNFQACLDLKHKQSKKKTSAKEAKTDTQPRQPSPKEARKECPFTSTLCLATNFADSSGWVAKADLAEPAKLDDSRTTNCLLQYQGLTLNDQNMLHLTDDDIKKQWHIQPSFEDNITFKFDNKTLDIPMNYGGDGKSVQGKLSNNFYTDFMNVLLNAKSLEISYKHKALLSMFWDEKTKKHALESFAICRKQEKSSLTK